MLSGLRCSVPLPPWPARRLAGGRRLCAAGALLAAVLCAAQAQAAPATSPPQASAPVAAASAPARSVVLDPRLAALENEARARPRQALAQLGGLLRALPAAGAQRVYALALQGVLQAQREDREGAELSIREIEALPRPAPSAAAAAGLVRATLTQRSGPLSRADRQASEALAQLPPDALPALRLRLLLLLAHVKDETGRFEEAVRLGQQAIRLADAGEPPWRQIEARANLAYTLLLAQQLDQAESMTREALQRAAAAADRLAESRALTVQAFLLGLRGDAAGELQAMQRVMEMARAEGAREDEVLGLANLADHYLKVGDHETALRLSREALPLARELADPAAESVALANVGYALISLRRLDEGLASVRRSMAIEERAGALTNMAMLEEELGHYLELAGYLREAVQANRRYRKLADEVFRRDQQQAILELQESFDNERRVRELELLQRENELKQAQLLGHQLQQRVWIAGSAVALLTLAVAGVMLHRLRSTGRRLEEGNALLQTQSERDPLTQLANRRHLQRLMQPEDGSEAPAFEGSLLLIDLDHFKQVNDRYGHAAGDAVLVEVARRLRATLRDEDLVVRWGGEEFLVIAQALSQEQTQALAQRLLTTIGGAPVALPDGTGGAAGADVADETGDAAAPGAPGQVRITASIGYACFPTEPTRLAAGWTQALELVDTALYLAKAHGRNLAYGVRLLHARDEQELQEISRGLEAAWSAGRVKLMPLRGPMQAAGMLQEPVA
jgi:diguanylate cyclase (GGDEF)-like protein